MVKEKQIMFSTLTNFDKSYLFTTFTDPTSGKIYLLPVPQPERKTIFINQSEELSEDPTDEELEFLTSLSESILGTTWIDGTWVPCALSQEEGPRQVDDTPYVYNPQWTDRYFLFN